MAESVGVDGAKRIPGIVAQPGVVPRIVIDGQLGEGGVTLVQTELEHPVDRM